MAGKIEVTRRSATRGQLNTAIELVFLGGDPVSAHVLASAASTVLRDLVKHQGKEPFDALYENHIRPEKLKIWWSAVNRDYNFFKHADKDADKEKTEFNPETTDFEIFAAIADYWTAFEGLTMPMLIFRGYMAKANPEIFLKGYLDQMRPGLDLFDKLGATPLKAAAELFKIYREHGPHALNLPAYVEK